MVNKPICYAYYEDELATYHIYLDDRFQLIHDFKLGTGLFDFVAMDSGKIFSYLDEISDMFFKQAANQDDIDEIIAPITQKVLLDNTNNNSILLVFGMIYMKFLCGLSDGISVAIYSLLEIINRITVDTNASIPAPLLTTDEVSYIYDMTTNNPKDIAGIVKTVLYDAIMRKQQAIADDLDLILKESISYKDYSPLQRLFLLDKENILKHSYLASSFQTHFAPDEYFDRADPTAELLAVRSGKAPVHETYDLFSIDDCIRFELVHLLKACIPFKPCKCCGFFFIPSGRSDSAYCSRLLPTEGKTCKEIGATLIFTDKHKDDPIHKAYTSAYQRMYSRKRQGTLAEKMFTSWGDQARKMEQDCYAGVIGFDEFHGWLDESKKR